PGCVPVRVPSEVRLALPTGGGLEAYRRAFAATGQAQHWLHVDAELPFAFRRLGDATLVEAYGLLFESWLRSPRWVRDTLGLRGFEVRLRRHLEETVGENWFQRPEGGQDLARLWRQGSSQTADELSTGFGHQGLEVEPLIEDLLEPRD